MKVEFRDSFLKDLRSIEDKKLLSKVRIAIEELEAAEGILELRNVKKLRRGRNFYRIRLGDHRIGFAVEEESIVLVRILNRKEIYRFFP
ncbi:MAG: type II toxin-antitoxin system RelE/ParE family toxin [Acidobacteria bacterium]|nr:type II toxin-antitoxin system RelE/ParE family toxin [Acidobacteriota bacterium]